jgi:Ca-activated chloride channel family protein
VIFANAATALGQASSTATTQQDDRIVVGTNLVTINVIVSDASGRYVNGLTQDQFTVYDNKVKQQIAHFSTGATPVSFGIICEIHESAPEQTRAMFAAIKQFTSTLQAEDDFFFLAFSEHGSVTTEFIPSWNQILDHLQFVKPGGASSLYDSVYIAAGRLQKTRNLKKALLVISDGQDTRSTHSYNKLRGRLRTLNAQIYAIGITAATSNQFARRWFYEDVTRAGGRRSVLMNADAAIGRAVLAEIARVSGGTTYFPETENEAGLTWICAQIAAELRQQYTLGFYSSASKAGEWHKLKVRISQSQLQSNLRLSYRKGYQVSGNE